MRLTGRTRVLIPERARVRSSNRLNAALEGRYSELGEGGMATVYLAKDLKHDRKVALKVWGSQTPPSLAPGGAAGAVSRSALRPTNRARFGTH